MANLPYVCLTYILYAPEANWSELHTVSTYLCTDGCSEPSHVS